MAESHGHSASPAKSKSVSGKKGIVRTLVEGNADLVDETGMGFFREGVNSIAHFFGAEGGKSSHGHK